MIPPRHRDRDSARRAEAGHGDPAAAQLAEAGRIAPAANQLAAARRESFRVVSIAFTTAAAQLEHSVKGHNASADFLATRSRALRMWTFALLVSRTTVMVVPARPADVSAGPQGLLPYKRSRT